jgi:hypothetical protein
MSRIQGFRKTLLAGFIFLGLASAASAQTAAPATGLGQPWPNAADLSANPNWHVYVFVLNGVEYVQVNDLNGTVHAAVGAANGTVVVLPMGVDSQNVSTSQPTTAGIPVYSDGLILVSAVPQTNGSTVWSAQPATQGAATSTQSATSSLLAVPATTQTEECGSCSGGGRGG